MGRRVEEEEGWGGCGVEGTARRQMRCGGKVGRSGRVGQGGGVGEEGRGGGEGWGRRGGVGEEGRGW